MGPPHEKGHASQKPQTQQTSVRVRVITSQCFDSRAMMRRRDVAQDDLPARDDPDYAEASREDVSHKDLLS